MCKIRWFCSVMMVLACWISSSAVWGQVNNGDFEIPGLADWTVTDTNGNSVVESGPNFGLSPLSGSSLAAFTGNAANFGGNGGVLSQVVPTTPGQEHTLTFFTGARGNTTNLLELEVSVVDAGGGGANLVDQSLSAPPTIGTWEHQGFSFTPSSDSVLVSFQETSSNSQSRGPAVDLVELEPLPAMTQQTTFNDFVFQTAADNGESPATSGQFAGPLYVRERANENNPELEVNAFLKFDLDGLSSDPITEAVLRLVQNNKLNSVNSSPLYVAQVLADWEPGLNDPTFDQAVGEDIFFGTNGNASDGPPVDIEHVIDLTHIVRQWQEDPASNFGVRLRLDDLFVGAAFDDTGVNAPQLIITQAQSRVIPEPTSATLLSSFCVLAFFGCSRRPRVASK